MQSFSRRGFLAATSVVAALPFGLAEAATPITLTSYPLPFVSIGIGGASLVALLDTGSVRGAQLTAAKATELGIALSDTGQTTQRYQNSGIPIRTGRVDLTLDGRQLQQEQIFVAEGDIERIAAQVQHPFEAIIGWPLLAREGFSADFQALQFSIGAPAASTGGLSLDDSHRIPLTTGRLGDADITLLVDTGAPSCTLDVSLAPDSAPGAVVTRSLSLGERTQELEFRIRDLSAMSRGTGAKAVLGLNAMRGKRLAFDPASRALTLS